MAVLKSVNAEKVGTWPTFDINDMYVFAHAGIGWILAEAGHGDRRFRQAVFLASLIPDIDGLSLLFGYQAYGNYHDRITHSIPFGVIVMMFAAIYCRKYRLKAMAFAALAYMSHLIGDFFLSGWPIALWYPFGRVEIESSNGIWLGHPINHILNAISVACLIWMGWRFKRTPFEVLSVNMDQRICNLLFRNKPLSCAYCGKKTNEQCTSCGKPVCSRHVPLALDFAVKCEQCKKSVEQGDPD